ncbi:MAG: DctP family TRAP transporter solute-binding subunit [Synergistales bacterium]|nr:DctP family TRAP transporter solute-binding subunit [Synergistales bacterium]
MARRSVFLVLLVALVMGIAAFAMYDVAEAAKKPMVIKFAHNGNTIPEDPQNVACYKFKEMVEERSNGELQVDIYPAAQLGDARTMVEGVQMGAIEMADIENGPMGRFVPEAMLWDLPFIFRDIDHAHNVLDGDVGKYVQEKYLGVGIRHLAFNDGGFRYFTNKVRPITNMSDLSGLKIRVMESKVMIDTINAFGASAVPMAFGELYTALQQGVVDGQENPMNLIYSQRFYEVQKYLSLSGHFYYPRQYIASQNWWQTLSEEHQKILAECAKIACDVQREELARYEIEMRKVLTEKGMEINEVDKTDFIKAAQEKIYPSFYATIGGGDEAYGKELVERVTNSK